MTDHVRDLGHGQNLGGRDGRHLKGQLALYVMVVSGVVVAGWEARPTDGSCQGIRGR